MSWGQSNGTRAAEAQRAHLTSSNLLSAASICVGGAFRCCTRGTGIESLAATRTTEPSLRNPEPTMGFEKVDGQRMVTLTDTPLMSATLTTKRKSARDRPRQVMREWGGIGERKREIDRRAREVRRSVTLVRDRVVVRRAEPAVVAARAFKAGRSERERARSGCGCSLTARPGPPAKSARPRVSIERGNHYRYPQPRNTVPFSARLLVL